VVASGAALSITPRAAAPASARTVIAPARTTSRLSRRGVAVGFGIAACLAVVVATASTVGTDILPNTASRADAADTSDLPNEVADSGPVGDPQEAGEVDPWTGKPYEETTKPGPKRPDAKPTNATPATLAPTPTTGADRDDLLNGGKPSTPVTPSDPSPTGGGQPSDVVKPTDGTVVDPPPGTISPVPTIPGSDPTINEPDPSVSSDPTGPSESSDPPADPPTGSDETP
jgi:molecular chaperone DnaK